MAGRIQNLWVCRVDRQRHEIGAGHVPCDVSLAPRLPLILAAREPLMGTTPEDVPDMVQGQRMDVLHWRANTWHFPCRGGWDTSLVPERRSPHRPPAHAGQDQHQADGTHPYTSSALWHRAVPPYASSIFGGPAATPATSALPC